VATSYLIDHVHESVLYISGNFPDAVRKSKALDLSVAFLRSEDIGARCSALRTLFRLTLKDSEEDRTMIDPNKLLPLASQQMPDEVILMQLLFCN
jgi:hypothetical protein